MSEATETLGEEAPSGRGIPRLADGISLHGEYEGGGYTEPRYLVSRSDGQMVLVSELLYRVTEGIDGHRDLDEVSAEVHRTTGKELSAPGVEYLVEDKLTPLGLARMDDAVDTAPKADPLLSLALRGVLIPARGVRVGAAILAPLFYPVVIALVIGGLIAVDIWAISSGYIDTAFHASVGNPLHLLAVIGLVVGGTLFHEFGHAAGCRYGGGRPGSIGVGIMIVFPAFYTNVTDAYRLSRHSRLRTDLGGIYFNVLFILITAGGYALTGYPPLLVAVVFNHLQALQQLLPLLRMDGYYILGDLVGVPNLFAHVRPFLQRLTGRHRLATPHTTAALRPKVRILVTAWVALVVPVLALALASLFIRVPRYLGTAIDRIQVYWSIAVTGVDHNQIGTVLLAVVSVLVLLLPWAGGIAFTIRTTRRISRAVARRHQRNQKPHARHRQAVSRRRLPRPRTHSQLS